MLVDYLLMSGALVGGGSALGLLILNRPDDGPRRSDGRAETRRRKDRGARR